MAAVQSVLKVLMITVAGAGVLSLGGMRPAHAGFDWTPPAGPVSATSDIPVPPAAAAVDPNLLTPEPAEAAAPVAPVEGAALKAEDLVAPAPVAESVEAPSEAAPVETVPAGMKTISSRDQQAEPPVGPGPRRVREKIDWSETAAAPVKAEPAEITPAPTASDQPLAPILSTTSVQGFAKDISLALALSQVVPPNYAYKFEDGVNPGQKVSWEGGKPWPQVLSDMLTASNLQVVIVGNVVTVQPAPGAAVPAVPQEAPVEEQKAEVTPAAPESEVKVARLSQADEAADLPVPVRSVSLSDTTEAQAAEANEKEAVAAASDEPLPVTPVVAASNKGSVPVVDIQTSRRWQATPGKTLRETLEGWSGIAGAEVEWMSPYDYPVDHAFVYEGKFDAAVDSLLSLYSREQQRPRGRLYPNLPTGPSVLMVN